MTTETYDKLPKLPEGLTLEGDGDNLPPLPAGLKLESVKKKVGGIPPTPSDGTGGDGLSPSGDGINPFSYDKLQAKDDNRLIKPVQPKVDPVPAKNYEENQRAAKNTEKYPGTLRFDMNIEAAERQGGDYITLQREQTSLPHIAGISLGGNINVDRKQYIEEQKRLRDQVVKNNSVLKADADKSLKEVRADIDKNIEYVTANVNEFTERSIEGDIIPDKNKISEYAKKKAVQRGVSDEGYYKDLLFNEVKANVTHKIIEPKVIETFNANYKKKYGKTPEEEITAEDVKKVKKEEEIIGKGKIQVQSIYAEVAKSAKEEIDALDESVNQDAKWIRHQYEAHAPLAKTEEEAKVLYGEATEAIGKLNEDFLRQQNAINSKYNARYRRQTEEIQKIANAKIQEESQKYKHERSGLQKRIEEEYRTAYTEVVKSNQEFLEKRDASLPAVVNFGRTFMTSLGGAIKGISSSMNFDTGKVFGDYLEGMSQHGSTELKNFSDFLDLTKVSKSMGSLAGGMTPALVAAGGTTLATGGAGAPAALSMLAGGVASWSAETAQMAGNMREEKFAETGSAALAEKAAKQTVDSQVLLMPLYAFDGLPFLGKSLKLAKNIPSRILLGGTIELGTEYLQEYPQNLFEEAIRDDKPYMEGLKLSSLERAKHTFLNIAPTFLLGGGGQAVGAISEKRDNMLAKSAAKAFALKTDFSKIAPDMQGQFVFDMMQRKGKSFSTAYVGALFSNGTIDETQSAKLLSTIKLSEDVITNSGKYGLSPAIQKVYGSFALKRSEALAAMESESDPILRRAAEVNVQNIENDMVKVATGEQADYTVVTLPNNEQYVMTQKESGKAANDESFTNAYSNGDILVKTYGKRGIIQEKLDEIDAQKKKRQEAGLSQEEQAAIEGIQDGNFEGTGISTWTNIIQDPNASYSDKKQALKDIYEQLTAEATEATVGTALGKKADLIYDLNYEKPVESEALKQLTDKPSTPMQDPQEGATEGVVPSTLEPKEIITPEGFQNRIHEGGVVLGSPTSESHVTEQGYTYRSVGEGEIAAISETGGVFSREGKQKGGNTNVKYWSRGNGKFFYRPSQNVIRVKNENISEGKVVSAENLEIWDKSQNKFIQFKKPDTEGVVPSTLEDDAYVSKYPKPSKPISQMSSEELVDHSMGVKKYLKDIEVDMFGVDGAKKYREAQRVLNNTFVSTSSDTYKEASELVDKMEASLSPAQQKEFFGLGEPGEFYEPSELRDIATRVRLVEESENVQDLGGALKLPLLDFNRNQNSEATLAVLNAAKNRAEQLGIDPKEMLVAGLKRIARDIRDRTDIEDLAVSIIEKLSTPIAQPKLQQQSTPTNEAKETAQDTKQTKAAITEPAKPDKAGSKAKKSVLERPIEEVTIEDILKELIGDEGLAFRDVSNKDIKEGDTKDIEAYNQRAERVLKTLYPNAEFKALNTTKEYEQATGRRGEAGVLIRGKEGKHKLFLNLEAIINSDIERTATHEVVHALVSDAIGAKYVDLRKKWDSLLPKLYKVKGFEIVKEHIEKYSSADRPVEGITDLLANIVHDKIKIEDIPKNLWDEFIELVNRAFEAIGLDYKITPDTFNGFASSVKEAFETGDFRNLKKFTSKSKTEKFFKEYPEFAESASAMIDPEKRKQLEELLRTKIQQELNQGKINQDQANEFYRRAGVEPPTALVTAEGEEGGRKGITHAAVAVARERVGLPEYEGRPTETHQELLAEARTRIAENPNIANEVMQKIDRGDKITNKDNAILAVYKGALDAELEVNPSRELYDRISRLAKVLDPSGTEAGKLLESRKLFTDNGDSLSNFLLEKEAAQGAPLTDAQLKNESAKYQELKDAKEKLEKQLEEERAKHAKDIAELGVNKAKAKARKEAKKTDAEYKKERVELKKSIKEKWEAAGKDILSSDIPFRKQLAAIAPDVKKMMQNIIDNGVDRFDDIITDLHAELKDVIDGIKKSQIIDIIAGDYDEVKDQTRNEKANSARLLKRESELIKELAAARKGEEKAKSEKEKIASTRRIDELKEKIKEVRALGKNTDADPVEDLTAGSNELLAKEEKRLQKKIEKLTKDLKEGNYLKEPEKKQVFSKSRKAQIMEDRVIDLENKIRHERSKDEYEKRSKWRKGFDYVMQVLGVKRLVQTAVDMSTSFRQGATLIGPRNIDVWAKGFQANLKSIFSPTKFERIMYAIRHDQQYHDMVKDGIVFNDLGSADPDLHNEDFRKSFLYKIPILSEPLKASNRSADAFLNVARYELYKKMRRRLEQQGLTRESDPKAFKYAGGWVMNMTGRGNMHSALEKPAMNAVLGNTFYGARLMASRFNILNPVTYFDPRVPRAAKVEAMKDMASFTVTVMAAGLALVAAGGSVSLDPDDPDFLQVRFGDKVYDISGGLATYVRTFLRMVKAGYTKATGNKYEGRKATEKAGQSALMFFRNKLSPNTAYATDAFFGKAYGQEFDASEIYAIYPMYADDAIKAYQDEGMMSIPTVLLPNILGIGYGNYASKGQIDANLEDLLKRNMRSNEMNSEKIRNFKDKGRPITDDEFDEYADKRDAEIEKDIKVLYEKGILGVPYSDLTKEEVADETSYIKAAATRKVKEEMFGKQKKTSEEKRADKKLSKEREEKYKKN